MEKLKITEGEARLEQDNEQAVYVTTDVKSNLYAMGKVFKGALMEKEEWESNAKLWVDAHNTHNKCHKLPSGLLEENRELVEACEDAQWMLNQLHKFNTTNHIDPSKTIEKLQALLTKVNCPSI